MRAHLGAPVCTLHAGGGCGCFRAFRTISQGLHFCTIMAREAISVVARGGNATNLRFCAVGLACVDIVNVCVWARVHVGVSVRVSVIEIVFV